MKTKKFTSFPTVLVPIIYGCQGQSALDAARALGAQVMLVGLVPVPPEASLSTGASLARQVRQQMRALVETGPFHSRIRVIVSSTRARTSSLDHPSCSGPNATSSNTVGLNSCASASWKTSPTRLRKS